MSEDLSGRVNLWTLFLADPSEEYAKDAQEEKEIVKKNFVIVLFFLLSHTTTKVSLFFFTFSVEIFFCLRCIFLSDISRYLTISSTNLYTHTQADIYIFFRNVLTHRNSIHGQGGGGSKGVPPP